MLHIQVPVDTHTIVGSSTAPVALRLRDTPPRLQLPREPPDKVVPHSTRTSTSIAQLHVDQQAVVHEAAVAEELRIPVQDAQQVLSGAVPQLQPVAYRQQIHVLEHCASGRLVASCRYSSSIVITPYSNHSVHSAALTHRRTVRTVPTVEPFKSNFRLRCVSPVLVALLSKWYTFLQASR